MRDLLPGSPEDHLHDEDRSQWGRVALPVGTVRTLADAHGNPANLDFESSPDKAGELTHLADAHASMGEKTDAGDLAGIGRIAGTLLSRLLKQNPEFVERKPTFDS